MAWAEPTKKRGWKGRYRDAKGRTQTAGYASTEKKAKALGRDQEAKIRNGSWLDPSAGKITFSEYFEKQWLPNRGGELNTLANYRSHYNAKRCGLKVEFGDTQLRSIRRSTVQGWVTRMIKDNLSPVTIQCRVSTLQTVLAARKGASAISDELIATNPCHGVQLPYAPKREVLIYEPAQVELLLSTLDPWWRPLPMLDSETGLRWGELMGAQVDDFTLGFRSLHVRRTILELTREETGNGTRFLTKDYPKEKGARFIALSSEASAMVATVVAERRLSGSDRLFSMPDKAAPAEWHPPLTLEWTAERTKVWPQGLPISRNYFRESIWKPAVTAAGLPKRKFHALRASHISWLLAGGADLATVMERAGHTQFTTTKRYTGVMQDADRRALDALAATKARYR